MSDSAAATILEKLGDTPLVDGHNDLPFRLRERFRSDPRGLDLTDTRGEDPPLHTDWRRLKAGGVGAQFWVAYLPCEEAGEGAGRRMLEQVDLIVRMVDAYPEHTRLATTAEQIREIRADGRIASLIGLEGGHGIESSLAVLRTARARGARYLTLTHNDHCEWADSATDEPLHDGLTGFGREVVEELNRLGMMVDLSHTSPATMRDALDASRAPVVFTHSCARALTDHPRNVPDRILERMAAAGGLVMATFVPRFVSEPVRRRHARLQGERARLRELHPADVETRERLLGEWERENPAPTATVADVADHLDHLKAVAGAAHVGIGSDYDGIDEVPDGLEDAACFPALLRELDERGWSQGELRALAGENLLRVLQEVTEAADPPWRDDG